MTKTMQNLVSTVSPRGEGYADALLDQIRLPHGGGVSVIVLACNSFEMLRAHLKPLNDDQLSSEREWWGNADVHANVNGYQFAGIAKAAKRRWPRVRVFLVPGCLCCNRGESLLAYEL